MSSVAVVSEELSLLTPLFGLELDSRFGSELDQNLILDLDLNLILELDLNLIVSITTLSRHNSY